MFPIVNGEGVPLEVVLDNLKSNNTVLDWLDFFNECIKHGWNPNSTLSKIDAAVGDVYGPKIKEEIINRLKTYMALSYNG